MRAIQVRSFGGPEVLELVVLADPVPAHGELLVRVTVRASTTPTPIRSRTPTSAGPSSPSSPAPRSSARSSTLAALQRRVCGFVARGGGYAELAVVPAMALRRAGRRLRRAGAVAARAGAHRAGTSCRTCARRCSTASPSSSTPRPAASATSRPDREAGGRRTRHRDGVDPGQARPRARPRRRRRRRARQPRRTAHDITHLLVDANGGARSTSCWRWSAGRPSTGASARSRRSAGSSRSAWRRGGSRTAIQPGSLMVGSHSVIGFWLVDCMRPDRAATMVVGPLAELVAQVADGRLRPIDGAHLPSLGRPARARGHARPHAPPARSCSTRDWTEHTRDPRASTPTSWHSPSTPAPTPGSPRAPSWAHRTPTSGWCRCAPR